jgi:hypothetical protein
MSLAGDICSSRRSNIFSGLNVEGLNHNDQPYHRLTADHLYEFAKARILNVEAPL